MTTYIDECLYVSTYKHLVFLHIVNGKVTSVISQLLFILHLKTLNVIDCIAQYRSQFDRSC